MRADEVRSVREAIATLPREYREVIVLRELEELSYKDATLARTSARGVPL